MILSSSLKPFISLVFHFLLLHCFISHHQCHASPAGVEAILDPLGDLVQVAPFLASHQEQAEKLSQSLTKPSKTPSGTVKCSCQTVSSDLQHNFPSDSPKTVEIEIYKDSFAAAAEGEDREDTIQTPEGKEDRIDDDGEIEDESQLESLNQNNRKPVRNSFSLENDEISPGIVGEPEEQTPFLSFLSQLVSSSAQHQQQEASQPENFEIEAEHKENDDHATLKLLGGGGDSDLFDSSRKDYKAYRTTDLLGAVPSPLDEVSSEKMDSGGGNDQFFLWDFIYADRAANNLGKKRELLQLGTVTDPFKGPRRRRRRRRRSLRGTGNDPRIVYIYPVGYQQDVKSPDKEEERSDHGQNQLFIQENKTNSQVHQKPVQMRSDVVEVVDIDDHEEIQKAMQAAMDRAWEQYGPKGLDAPPVTPAPPTQGFMIPASDQPLQPPLPFTQNADQRTQQYKENVQKQQEYHQQQQQQKHPQDLVYYSPPRPFLFIDRIFNPFQPMTSEWDKHVTTFEGPLAPPPQPGFFSRLMASYIDFEVNNHETADLMRRVVFAMFVGFLIAGWIALGAALGFVPLKKLLAFVAGTHYDSNTAETKRLDKGKEFQARDATISDLTDKILLSLDADWLKRLEDRVMGTSGGNTKTLSTKLPTQVFCCILPDEEASGMVECEVLRGSSHHHSNKKKTSAFKCISDLIYNFHFGPREDEVGEEQDNYVNIKSKANNSDDDKRADGDHQEEPEWNENSKSVDEKH